MKLKKEKLFFHTPYNQLLENLDLLGALLINCEIYVSANAIDTHTQEEINRINEQFDKYGLLKTVHGPYIDLNPGSFDEHIREVTSIRFRQAIDFCCKLSATQIVLHTHFHPIFYQRQFEKWLKFSKQTWEPIIQQALKRGITIVIENSIENSPEPATRLIEMIGADNFKACFDIGHYSAFCPEGWEYCLARYRPDSIKEVHMSDNDGTGDQHLRLGTGVIDFKKFLNRLSQDKIDPVITVEPHALADIQKNIEYLESI